MSADENDRVLSPVPVLGHHMALLTVIELLVQPYALRMQADPTGTGGGGVLVSNARSSNTNGGNQQQGFGLVLQPPSFFLYLRLLTRMIWEESRLQRRLTAIPSAMRAHADESNALLTHRPNHPPPPPPQQAQGRRGIHDGDAVLGLSPIPQTSPPRGFPQQAGGGARAAAGGGGGGASEPLLGVLDALYAGATNATTADGQHRGGRANASSSGPKNQNHHKGHHQGQGGRGADSSAFDACLSCAVARLAEEVSEYRHAGGSHRPLSAPHPYFQYYDNRTIIYASERRTPTQSAAPSRSASCASLKSVNSRRALLRPPPEDAPHHWYPIDAPEALTATTGGSRERNDIRLDSGLNQSRRPSEYPYPQRTDSVSSLRRSTSGGDHPPPPLYQKPSFRFIPSSQETANDPSRPVFRSRSEIRTGAFTAADLPPTLHGRGAWEYEGLLSRERFQAIMQRLDDLERQRARMAALEAAEAGDVLNAPGGIRRRQGHTHPQSATGGLLIPGPSGSWRGSSSRSPSPSPTHLGLPTPMHLAGVQMAVSFGMDSEPPSPRFPTGTGAATSDGVDDAFDERCGALMALLWDLACDAARREGRATIGGGIERTESTERAEDAAAVDNDNVRRPGAMGSVSERVPSGADATKGGAAMAAAPPQGVAVTGPRRGVRLALDLDNDDDEEPRRLHEDDSSASDVGNDGSIHPQALPPPQLVVEEVVDDGAHSVLRGVLNTCTATAASSSPPPPPTRTSPLNAVTASGGGGASAGMHRDDVGGTSKGATVVVASNNNGNTKQATSDPQEKDEDDDQWEDATPTDIAASAGAADSPLRRDGGSWAASLGSGSGSGDGFAVPRNLRARANLGYLVGDEGDDDDVDPEDEEYINEGEEEEGAGDWADEADVQQEEDMCVEEGGDEEEWEDIIDENEPHEGDEEGVAAAEEDEDDVAYHVEYGHVRDIGGVASGASGAGAVAPSPAYVRAQLRRLDALEEAVARLDYDDEPPATATFATTSVADTNAAASPPQPHRDATPRLPDDVAEAIAAAEARGRWRVDAASEEAAPSWIDFQRTHPQSARQYVHTTTTAKKDSNVAVISAAAAAGTAAAGESGTSDRIHPREGSTGRSSSPPHGHGGNNAEGVLLDASHNSSPDISFRRTGDEAVADGGVLVWSGATVREYEQEDRCLIAEETSRRLRLRRLAIESIGAAVALQQASEDTAVLLWRQRQTMTPDERDALMLERLEHLTTIIESVYTLETTSRELLGEQELEQREHHQAVFAAGPRKSTPHQRRQAAASVSRSEVEGAATANTGNIHRPHEVTSSSMRDSSTPQSLAEQQQQRAPSQRASSVGRHGEGSQPRQGNSGTRQRAEEDAVEGEGGEEGNLRNGGGGNTEEGGPNQNGRAASPPSQLYHRPLHRPDDLAAVMTERSAEPSPEALSSARQRQRSHSGSSRSGSPVMAGNHNDNGIHSSSPHGAGVGGGSDGSPGGLVQSPHRAGTATAAFPADRKGRGEGMEGFEAGGEGFEGATPHASALPSPIRPASGARGSYGADADHRLLADDDGGADGDEGMRRGGGGARGRDGVRDVRVGGAGGELSSSLHDAVAAHVALHRQARLDGQHAALPGQGSTAIQHHSDQSAMAVAAPGSSTHFRDALAPLPPTRIRFDAAIEAMLASSSSSFVSEADECIDSGDEWCETTIAGAAGAGRGGGLQQQSSNSLHPAKANDIVFYHHPLPPPPPQPLGNLPIGATAHDASGGLRNASYYPHHPTTQVPPSSRPYASLTTTTTSPATSGTTLLSPSTNVRFDADGFIACRPDEAVVGLCTPPRHTHGAARDRDLHGHAQSHAHDYPAAGRLALDASLGSTVFIGDTPLTHRELMLMSARSPPTGGQAVTAMRSPGLLGAPGTPEAAREEERDRHAHGLRSQTQSPLGLSPLPAGPQRRPTAAMTSAADHGHDHNHSIRSMTGLAPTPSPAPRRGSARTAEAEELRPAPDAVANRLHTMIIGEMGKGSGKHDASIDTYIPRSSTIINNDSDKYNDYHQQDRLHHHTIGSVADANASAQGGPPSDSASGVSFIAQANTTLHFLHRYAHNRQELVELRSHLARAVEGKHDNASTLIRERSISAAHSADASILLGSTTGVLHTQRDAADGTFSSSSVLTASVHARKSGEGAGDGGRSSTTHHDVAATSGCVAGTVPRPVPLSSARLAALPPRLAHPRH